MAMSTTVGNDRLWRGLRWVVWGGAAMLLLLPLVAMQFTADVRWSPFDFALMGLMLALVGGAYELAVRVARSHVYVVAFGVAVLTAFLMTWANLAVGIIGEPDNPANLLFFGVIAVAVIGAVLARLQSPGMARAMIATAIAQAATCVAALVLDGVYVFVLTGVFVVLWLIAAQLFRTAARRPAAVMPPR
ncbi:Hypothetical protein I596_2853 [Dokdonella koreensis DS-123]|uniref:Uncharacterized protein n=2 Tax=Dokdonella TaxID=323413 RepID=A0A167H4A6_9GAMM|nr:Hypothetical protein I596_2853 [Dokdonella koreensis DS-123]